MLRRRLAKWLWAVKIVDLCRRGASQEFPAPFSLGGRRVAWWLSDIAIYTESLRRKR